MVSERVETGVRAALLPIVGAAAALAWTGGLYATTVLAALVALWTAALVVLSATPPSVTAPVSAPVPAAGEAELRRLTAYLDLSPAPLVALDDKGRLRVVNRAARRLLSAEDLISDPLPPLVDALTRTPPGRTTTVELPGDSGPRPFALATGDLWTGGEPTRIGALIDIGAELKVAEAGALREMMEVLSHEIVGTLTPIASLAQTAADMLDDPDPALPAIRDAVKTVARRATGLRRFGERYRGLARLPAPTVRLIETGPLVADLRRLFAARRPSVPLLVHDADAPPHLRGDPDQLSAALWALLQNAAEAVAEGGSPRVELRIDAGVGAVAFEVVDHGVGVAPGDAQAVFAPFFTTKPEGTGVGLTLARQIFRGHGGELTLMPDPGGATCFRGLVPDRR